jgi:hypothetical protein
MEPIYRGLFAGDEVHAGGAASSGSGSDDDALVVSSSRLLDAKTARLRELRARCGHRTGLMPRTVSQAFFFKI